MKTSSQTMSSGQFVLKLWLCLNFFATLVFVASTDITVKFVCTHQLYFNYFNFSYVKMFSAYYP